MFENRTIPVYSGGISDYLPAFGSQVYLINTKPVKELIKPYRDNLIKDPGFEDISNPGVPASCYAWNEGDRGSTFFLDSREHFEGNHSLRMVTPRKNRGTRLRFFPVNIELGRTYIRFNMGKDRSCSERQQGIPVFRDRAGRLRRERGFTPELNGSNL